MITNDEANKLNSLNFEMKNMLQKSVLSPSYLNLLDAVVRIINNKTYFAYSNSYLNLLPGILTCMSTLYTLLFFCLTVICALNFSL